MRFHGATAMTLMCEICAYQAQDWQNGAPIPYPDCTHESALNLSPDMLIRREASHDTLFNFWNDGIRENNPGEAPGAEV